MQTNKPTPLSEQITQGDWKISHSGFANAPFVIYAGDKSPNYSHLQPLQGVNWVAEVKCDESPDYPSHVANAAALSAVPKLLKVAAAMNNLLLWLSHDMAYLESIADWGSEVGSPEVQRILIRRAQRALDDSGVQL